MPLKLISTILSIFLLPSLFSPSPARASASQGYWTTPEELRLAKQKADAGEQPFKNAYDEILNNANSQWPGKMNISGSVNVDQVGSYDQHFFRGGVVLYAKAIRYSIKGNESDARFIRDRLVDATDVSFSGDARHLLPAWQIPAWIQSAVLIEGSSSWSANDKLRFQRWLRDRNYAICTYNGRLSDNNHGSACGYLNAMIGDYLIGSGLNLSESNPKSRTLTPQQAYQEYTDIQLQRMNWKNSKLETSKSNACDRNGIMPSGGIPAELRRARGTIDLSWCYLNSLPDDNNSAYTYQITHLGGTIPHAEMARRRGDNRLFENGKSDGSGSILNAIHYIIDNDYGRSFNWIYHNKTILYPAQQYYDDPQIARQIYGGDKNNQESISGNYIYYTQFTHGSSQPLVDINPGGGKGVDACTADINQNKRVDLADFTILVSNFFNPNPNNPRADINRDGLVDLIDYTHLVKFFSQSCSN